MTPASIPQKLSLRLCPQLRVPGHWHAQIAQKWFLEHAMDDAAPDATDIAGEMFLAHYLCRVGLPSSREKLFMTHELLGWLNARDPRFPAPFTRLMGLIYELMQPEEQQKYDVTTPLGKVQFIFAMAHDVTSAHRLPAAMMADEFFEIFQKPTHDGLTLGLHMLAQKHGINLAHISTAAPHLIAQSGADRRLLPPSLRHVVATPSPLSAPAFIMETDVPHTPAQAHSAAADVALHGQRAPNSGFGVGLLGMANALETQGLMTEIYSDTNADASQTSQQKHVRHISAPVIIQHCNSDYNLIESFSGDLSPFISRFHIGVCVWETSQLSPAHLAGAGWYDEIWCPSRFVQTQYQQQTNIPTSWQPLPVSLPTARQHTRRDFVLPHDACLFGFVFDTLSRYTRKNPLAVVKAFLQAFPAQKDVCLVLKTHRTDMMHPADQPLYDEMNTIAARDGRIRIITEAWPYHKTRDFISQLDVYVSLHRAEGYGLTVAEAMASGVPVIGTNWSGTQEFLNDQTGLPVNYTLIPVRQHEFTSWGHGQQWAEPNIDHAAAHMKKLYDDATLRKKLGQKGQQHVVAHFSPEACGQRYAARLAELGFILPTPDQRRAAQHP